MSLFPKQPDLIGIEIGSTSVRLACLRQKKRTFSVIHIKEFPLKGDLPDSLIKDSILATALPAHQTLVRPLFMQLKKEKDILSALDFQVENLLPFPASEAVIDSQIVSQTDKGSSLAVSFVKKDHLKKHLEKASPLVPERVTSIYSALCSFSTLLLQSAHRLLMVHVGDEHIACALVEKGKLLKAHSFERSKDFQAEIKKTVLSLSQKSFESIYLLGSDDPFYVDEIKKATGQTPLYPSIPSLNLPSDRLVKFGVAIGIALASQTTNFRKKEFAYPFPMKRFKKTFKVFVGLSLILTAAFVTLAKFSLSRQQLRVSYAYQTLLATTQTADPTAPSTPSDYAVELQKIETAIMKKPDTYPLMPGVPSVRETLAFLTNQAPGITFQDFHYQLVKRPQFSHKKEHYQVRVDLQFRADNAQAARKLHEKLCAKNALVDPKKEVTWETTAGLYKTSFFLKDKTRYHG